MGTLVPLITWAPKPNSGLTAARVGLRSDLSPTQNALGNRGAVYQDREDRRGWGGGRRWRVSFRYVNPEIPNRL